MRAIVVAAMVAFSMFPTGEALGQELTANEILDNLTASDITESLVAFNGFVGNPGIGGMKITLENEPGQPDTEYSKGHFLLQKGFWLPGRNLAIYGALDLGRVKQDDPFIAENTRGEPVRFDMDRKIDTGRIGLGIAFMATRHVRIRPYFSFALSRIESKSNISSAVDISTFTPEIQAAFTDWKEQSRTFAGTIDVKYKRIWEQKKRFEPSIN